MNICVPHLSNTKPTPARVSCAFEGGVEIMRTEEGLDRCRLKEQFETVLCLKSYFKNQEIVLDDVVLFKFDSNIGLG